MKIKDITPQPLEIISKKEKLSFGLSFRDDLEFGSGKPDSRANKREVFADNNAPSGSVRVGDLWFDTDDDNTAYRWNGSAWVSVKDGGIGDANWSTLVDDDGNKPEDNATYNTGNLADLDQVDTNQIVNAAVEEAKIASLAVTGGKIAANAVQTVRVRL